MALNDKQFQILAQQLQKKRAALGDDEYSAFLQRAASASQPPPPADNDGFVKDAFQGVAKSDGELVLGIGTIGRSIQKGISRGVDKLFGTSNFGLGGPGVFDKGSDANNKAQELIKRDTFGEKLGGVIGDVASFAIPGGAAARATKGAGFLTRAATLGAADATTAVAREGELNREAVDAAIIGAAFPVAGKGVDAAKTLLPSGKDAGGRVINSLIKPLLKDFSYGKNPGNAVASEGIVANSLDELAQKITVARQRVGSEIGEKVAQNTTVFSVPDALQPLDDAIKQAAKNPRTNKAIIRRLEDLKDDLLRLTTDAEGNDTVGRTLDNLSAQEVFDLKREIGDLTRWTGNQSDDEIVNKALKQVYGGLKQQLDDAIPDIRALNDRFADLRSAEIATTYRDKIAARQNLVSLPSTGVGAATAVVSAIVSGGALVPIIAGAGAAGLTQAARTPAVKTRLAAWLASAPPKEVQEAFRDMPWLRGTLQTILLGEEVPEESQSSKKEDRKGNNE